VWNRFADRTVKHHYSVEQVMHKHESKCDCDLTPSTPLAQSPELLHITVRCLH